MRHFSNRRLAQCAICVLLTACAASTNAEKLRTPTTAPVMVKLSDAQPLEQLESDDAQTNLTDKLTTPQAIDTVYFGEIDQFNSGDDQTPISAVAVIALHQDDQWKAVALAGPGLTDAGWKYVGAGPGPKEIWGVLDTSAGDSRSKFVLAHSTDGGNQFSLQVIRKPCKLAAVYDFAMTRDGQGRVSLSLEAACGKFKPGLYSYETSDDGKTWSTVPRFEPDAMIHADTVSDDEQPDVAAGVMRTGFKVWKKSAHVSKILP